MGAIHGASSEPLRARCRGGPAQKAGLPTAVYYAKGLHRQTAYRDYPAAGNGLPVSDSLSGEVLSLPMHPYLDERTQDRIVEALHAVLKG